MRNHTWACFSSSCRRLTRSSSMRGMCDPLEFMDAICCRISAFHDICRRVGLSSFFHVTFTYRYIDSLTMIRIPMLFNFSHLQNLWNTEWNDTILFPLPVFWNMSREVCCEFQLLQCQGASKYTWTKACFVVWYSSTSEQLVWIHRGR